MSPGRPGYSVSSLIHSHPRPDTQHTMDDSGLIVDADSCFGSAVLLSSAELASGPITPPAAAPVPARPPPPHHAAVVSPSPARLTTESLLQSSSGAEADGREPLKSLLAASPSAGTSRPSFPPALLGAYDPLPRLPQPPITPSSPSPTFPASSSWTTPLSSSLCSLSSLSGPSSPGGSGTGPDLDERGGAAQGGQASRSAAASSDEGDGTDLSADSIEALDPRSSNGDLILPTLPSIAASDSLESTLRPFPGAQQQSLGPSPALIRRRVRLALVGAEEGGRGWLVGRLGEVLGLDGFSGWRTGEAGELLGFLPALTAGKEGDEGEGIELVMTLHPVKPVRSCARSSCPSSVVRTLKFQTATGLDRSPGRSHQAPAHPTPRAACSAGGRSNGGRPRRVSNDRQRSWAGRLG